MLDSEIQEKFSYIDPLFLELKEKISHETTKDQIDILFSFLIALATHHEIDFSKYLQHSDEWLNIYKDIYISKVRNHDENLLKSILQHATKENEEC